MQCGRDYMIQRPHHYTNALPSIVNGQCQRCHSNHVIAAPCNLCEQMCLYCVSCVSLGKVCACCDIVTLVNKEHSKRLVNYCWQGTLSSQQQEGSNRLLQAIKARETILLSAVTGAGKTEMMFASIVYALEQGYRIAICTPRVDVLLELTPRIQNVLPDEDIMVLYGGQTELYRYTQLVLATTHQLLKFTKAFDVIVLDEVDAFPFQENAMLEYGLKRALAPLGSIVYMTATPTPQQKVAIKKGRLPVFELPARYHKHALVVPVCLFVGDWKKDILLKRERWWFKQLLRVIESGRRFLLFCPQIDVMFPLERWLINNGITHFTSVYAQDDKRIEKVNDMRKGRYQFLLTTTILERGVTFENIDVIVLGAEHHHFTQAALVQIAGRVGRVVDFPTGNVWFWHNGKTCHMKRAICFIKQMNIKAKEKGWIN